MAIRHIKSSYRLFHLMLLIVFSSPAYAQLAANTDKDIQPANLSFKYVATNYSDVTANTATDNKTEYIANAVAGYDNDAKILQNLESDIKIPRQRKQLLAYLKQLNINSNPGYNQSHIKLYYRLANTFARLKFYPLAMKCFFKTMQYANGRGRAIPPADSSLNGNTDSIKLADSYLAINSNDDSVINKQPALLNAANVQVKSKAINYQQIVSTFNDGKKTVGYAVLFHVKQPAAGKRKIFLFTNTGHTFITLIKYNADSTYVSLSFGFYPHKDNILSATPLEPETSAVFKDDSRHQWDEVLGKFISKRRFEKILALTKQYNSMEYHLSKNNCTDFGLNAATLAGISITDTSGKWPLGSGNNPAVTGQSILQGKYINTDSNDPGDLFIDTGF